MVPHSYVQFDNTRRFSPSDFEFKKNKMKLTLKWSKTRDRAHKVILPKLHPSVLCPVLPLKVALAKYTPDKNDPLFLKLPEMASKWSLNRSSGKCCQKSMLSGICTLILYLSQVQMLRGHACI